MTLKKINKELADLGFQERLARGNGYFYFYDGDASAWPQTGVYVYRLRDLSLEQWIEEAQLLREQYNEYILP